MQSCPGDAHDAPVHAFARVAETVNRQRPEALREQTLATAPIVFCQV